MKKFFYISLCFLFVQSVASQNLFKRAFEPKQIVLIDLTYKLQYPGFDMIKRFGSNSAIGGEILLKNKKNLILGINGYFIWGKNVKETGILDSLRGSTGEIIDQNGQFSVIGFEQRGMSTGVVFGKVFSINKNKNSGIQINVGAGYLNHYIRIFAPKTVPQLNNEMKKGYDRYTSGPYISQYIGYRFIDPIKRLNFSLGFEFIEGFTHSRRSFNYDTQTADNKNRLDLLSGLKLSLTIPLYLKKASEEEFFE